MHKGFIRIELLILLTVLFLSVLITAFAYLSASEAARDKKRITDITQIQKALEIFYKENGFYPPSSSNNPPIGLSDYLERWPQAPKADGSCQDNQNTYIYSQRSGGDDYSLAFCLGKKYDSLASGPHMLTSKEVE